MDLSQFDADMIARTAAAEAGDAGPEAMAAVISSIKNRLDSGRYGDTIPQIILAPHQYEPWSLPRRNQNHPLRVSPDSDDYKAAYQATMDIFGGNAPDTSNGATHFVDPQAQRALGRRMPSWTRGQQPLATVGPHKFYAPEGQVMPDLLGEWAAATKGGDVLDRWGVKAPTPDTTAQPQSDDVFSRWGVQAPTEDLLGEWATSVGTNDELPPPRPGIPRIQVTPANAPQRASMIPAGPSATGDMSLAAQLGSQGGIPGAIGGFAKGIGDVASTLNTGIDWATSKAADALASAGVISPDTAAQVNTSRNALAAHIAEQNAQFAPYDKGWAGAGRIAGQVVGGLPVSELAGAAMPALGLLTPVVRGAAGGAAATAASATASDQPLLEQLKGGAETGAIVGPIAAGAGRVANALLGPMIDPGTARLAQIARNQFNIPVGAGQMAPKQSVTRFADSVLQRVPFSGHAASVEAQQTGLNRAIAATMGENADHITPDVMANARDRLGTAFDSIANRTSINADAQFGNDLSRIIADAQQVLTPDELRPLIHQVQNVTGRIDPATNAISGESYQALTRKGTPLDRNLQSQNPNTRYYAGQVREALDDAMERSAPPDVVDELRTARAQWRSMRTVESLVEKSPTGDLSPALLLGAVRRAQGQGLGGRMAYGGGGDLANLARIGQRFMAEPQSSGTSERLLAMKALGALGAAGVGAADYKFDPDNFQRNALLALATVGGGRLASGAMRSNTLANFIINRGLAGPLLPGGLPNVVTPAAALAGRNALQGP